LLHCMSFLLCLRDSNIQSTKGIAENLFRVGKMLSCMKKTFTYVSSETFRHAWLLLLILLSGLTPLCSYAQTVITSTSSFTNDESVATVTLNFENTNPFPVIITGVSGVLDAFGPQTVELWYKTSGVNGAPGNIATGNGWQQAGYSSVSGIANTTTTVTQPFFQSISLTVPANTTYGLAIAGYNGVGSQRAGVLTGPVTLSAGGCNIHTGPTIGYAVNTAPPAAPVTASKGWIGSITFMPATTCGGTPAAAVISAPPGICAGTSFSMNATGYTTAVGVSHQWQYYNTVTAAWAPVTGATGSICTITAGITASTQYRLVSTCASSGLQGISNVVTVGLGTGMASGTYTINKNLPVSATNFISFADATAALSCGVSGPVVINVTPGSGPYNETVKFGIIPGASATNTIKLNGNGNTVQYLNVSGELQMLTLSGTKYLKIDSLIFKTLSTTMGWGTLVTNSSAYDSISHCLFDMASQTGGVTSVNMNGIVFSASATAPVVWGDNGKSCYVGYNHIKGPNTGSGPFYGICLGGGLGDSNNVIAHNEVENFYNYGIYTYSGGNIKILYNDIHRTNKAATSFYYGIYAWGNYNNYTYNYATRIEIVGNRLHNPSNSAGTITAFYGITAGNGWYNDTLNTEDTVIIANNAIYNVMQAAASIWGIHFGNGNSGNTYVYHNTIDINQPIAGAGIVYGLWSNYYYWNNNNNYGTTYVKNNLVTITGGTTGAKYGFYYNDYNNNTGWDVEAQRNNFYVNSSQPGTQYYGNYWGVDYLTMAAFQAAHPTQEMGSLSVEPQYISVATGDLTPLNASLQGNGVNLQSIVPRDINGNPRSVTPTPGAFEFSTDAGVTSLVSPVGLFCSSVKQVKVTIANMGTNVINTVQVHWSLNGVAQTPVTYTGALGGTGNPVSAVVTLGNGLFLPNTATAIKAWTTLPNGLADPINYNDTLQISVQPSSSLPVNLGADAAICTGSSMTLDAGSAGSSFLWDNGWTNQTRNITAAGTYFVKVTGYDGCIGIDTFHLSLRALPVIDLGPDQAICLGSTTTLDPGNVGTAYLWDDGTTTQTRVVDTAGIYTVDVTDVFGCIGTDDITVIMKDIPRVAGINAIYGDTATYTFNPIDPLFILNYTWNFGDGSPLKTGQVVQHRYTHNGIYTVDLMVEGECTGLIIHFSRTVDVFDAGGGTGLVTLDDPDGLILYPNPAKEWVAIEIKAGLQMKTVTAVNVLGQKVYSSKADSGSKHRLSTTGLAAGIYTLKIETDKGILTRKFEVLH
jgi:hypothetical protein